MLSERIIRLLNPLFPKRPHPFNMQNAGEMTYAEWQFEKGDEVIRRYAPKYSAADLARGHVLDMGCGAGGKSVYYLTAGAEHVTGVDMVPSYKEQAEVLAEKKGVSHRFSFLIGDAGALPLPDNSFDTVIMNDFFEHASSPEAVLTEAWRLTKAGGHIFINFPPYGHPFGAHLSDAIAIPWVHMFFSEKAMITAYKKLVTPLPDGEERIAFRFSVDENGKETMSYINKMSIKRFLKILKARVITPEYLSYQPMARLVKPLTRVGGVREVMTKHVVCVLKVEK